MRAACLLLATALCAGALGCDEWEPMQKQARPNTWRASPVFPDGRAMRPPVPDTVDQDSYRQYSHLADAAQSPDGGWVDAMPLALTRELAEQGQLRFDVFCAPCHGLLANGESVVARKMTLRPPPNLLVPREAGRTLGPGELPRPLGFYYSVVSHGYGLMPSYADALDPHERWAVVAYLRALALSQRAPLALAPPDVQQRLARERP